MTRRASLVAGAVALFAPALPAGANSDAPGLAVSAWPARVVVAAPGRTVVGVGNPGDQPVRLIAQARAYSLDARGRPRIEAPETRWLAVRPARFVVLPHGVAQVRLEVRRPAKVRPGDHAALLLLSTEPPAGRRVAARLRLGVVVVVRVPGRLVRRLVTRRLRLRRLGSITAVDLAIVNGGNVDEWLGPGRITVSVVRGGWRMRSAPIEARRLLARSSGIVEARFRSRLRGAFDLVVELRQPRFGVALVRRRYHLRL